MEKPTFLLLVLGFCLVQCCDNFRYDNLVHFNGSAQCFEADSGRGGYQKQVADFFNDFSLFTFRALSTLPEDSQCRIHMNGVLEEAARLNMWALKLLDSSAKLPSGILSGNLNQLGDFDECLLSKGYIKGQPIQGKYCLANVGIKFDESQAKLKPLDAVIHSNRIVRSKFRDQGHRIPKFETFNVGVCVPASCGPQEIEIAFDRHLNENPKKKYVSFDVSISDELCYVEEESKLSAVGFGVRVMFSLITALILLGTLVDLNKIKLQNTKTNSAEDDIKCLHGARFLNALALLLSHKQIAMLFSPIQNRTEMSEAVSKSWTMIGRAAILYTDSFILFSGLLVSYSIVKDLDSKKVTNFKDKFISRLVRLMPNLVGVVLFCTYVMENLGSGPLWGLVVTKYTNLCKKYMWRNFLFIHNHFGFENMCLTHTHQLGIDMQLFILSPIFIYLIWRMPRLGVVILTSVAALSTWLRYELTHRGNLSTILYYGISVEQLWKTANMSYIMPAHRLTVYLMGVMLGYYLRRGGRQLNFSTLQASVGWSLAAAAGLLAVFGPYETAFKEYVYDVNHAARFNAFAPVLWSGFLCWGIVACVNGAGGILNSVLSWEYFRIFTKISYAVYLTQFPVFFYNVGTERSLQYFKGFQSLLEIEELSVVLIASVALTLSFDIPFQELKKVLTTGPASNYTERMDRPNEDIQTRQEGRQRKRRRLQWFGT